MKGGGLRHVIDGGPTLKLAMIALRGYLVVATLLLLIKAI